MDQLENEIREKLKEYIPEDIKFLKRQWREWIALGRFDLIDIS